MNNVINLKPRARLSLKSAKWLEPVKSDVSEGKGGMQAFETRYRIRSWKHLILNIE